MLRRYFTKLDKADNDNIRWRSHEVSRIEAFSDAVFAFALSLLVISLEVPRSSKELLEMMAGFFPFIFCFVSIFWIWRTQYKFFRRYGMHDGRTLALNGILLFVVLFFAYPLKFLFSSIIIPDVYKMRPEDFGPLAVIYNSAAASIYILFMLMYVNAYSQRTKLELTEKEIFETITFIYIHGAMVAIVALVIGGAAIGTLLHNDQMVNGSFALYAVAGIIMPWIGKKRDKGFHKRFGKAIVSEPHLSVEA